MKKDTYIVKCRCRNCRHEWDEKVEKGYFFVEGAGNSKYSSSPLTAISNNQEGYMWKRIVECPNCGTDNIQKM